MKKKYEYDAFISYASEDKGFTLSLAKELKKLGIKVWIDKFILKIGDKTSLKIGEGMAKSKYGIIVLSSNFLNKDYPKHELSGLIDKSISANNLLPIWHGISRDEIADFHPALADIFAIHSEVGIEKVSFELAKIIKPEIAKKPFFEIKKIKISEIKSGPIRHSDLPKSFLERIKSFGEKISEIEALSYEESVDSFKRDMCPGREIRIWEVITETYDDYILTRPLLSIEQKKEIYSIILDSSMQVLDSDNFKNLRYFDEKTAKNLEKNYRVLMARRIRLDSC